MLRLKPIILALALALSACTPLLGQWHLMSTAPHDGTTIEIADTYGGTLAFGLYHWADQVEAASCDTQGKCSTSVYKLPFAMWVGQKPGDLKDCAAVGTCVWREAGK